MTEDQFLEALAAEVQEIVESYGVGEDKAFLIWACERILSIDREDSYGAAIVGGKNDVGLDFGLIEREEGRIVLAQGKYSEKIDRDIIRGLLKLPEVLSDPAALRKREANKDVTTFARQYRAATESGVPLRLLLIHLGRLTPALSAELEGKIEDFGTDRLKQVYEDRSPLGFGEKPETIEISINQGDSFKLEDRPGKPRCYVARIPLKELHRLYQIYRAGLLDRNIRLHVGDRTPANKGMAATLKDVGTRDSFFYFNNGLCILASKIDKPEEVRGHVVIRLHDPQIVNGGQTYHTVGNTDEDLLEGASVLARIICPPSESEEFTDQVIRYNNTQTPVTSRDFHSNDDIQKRLGVKFEALHPAWFYERKEGLWNAMDPKFQSRFRRTSGRARSCFRIIDNETLAQCRLAWIGQPAIAKTDKRKIFEENPKEGGLYATIFPEGSDADYFVEEYIVAYRLNEMFSSKKKDWALQKKTAEDSGDENKIKAALRDSFIPFLNFFGIASIHYIMDKYYPKIQMKETLEPAQFDRLYNFIVTVFRVTLQAAQQASGQNGRSFNMGNWFKFDSHYNASICPMIDTMINVLDPSVH